eukprot:4576983-Pyramimonas_sp.AAC.1
MGLHWTSSSSFPWRTDLRDVLDLRKDARASRKIIARKAAARRPREQWARWPNISGGNARPKEPLVYRMEPTLRLL